METVAKLFMNGRSQAVRIPKAFRFEGVDSVIVRKDGDTLLIRPARVRPARNSWLTFPDDAPLAGDNFMNERPDLIQLERLRF